MQIALALVAMLLLAYAEPLAAAASAQVAVEVPSGKTKSVRLRNLPRGTLVSVRISASGKMQFALISAVQLKSRKPEALYRGALKRSVSFQVILPESSDYYLVLDNRRGIEPVKTRATIKAEKGPPEPQAPEQREKNLEGKFDNVRAPSAPQA